MDSTSILEFLMRCADIAPLLGRFRLFVVSAKLLLARKKNPDRLWLERVPIKAKTLEKQLYKNAASLEAYLNRATLKMRLGKLASAITSHYQQALRKDSINKKRGSTVSVGSLASLEDAFSDTKLRRESSSSTSSLPTTFGRHPPLSSEENASLTRSTAYHSNDSVNRNRNSHRGDNSNPMINNSSGNAGAQDGSGTLAFPNATRRQSDSSPFLSHVNRLSPSMDLPTGNNFNPNLSIQSSGARFGGMSMAGPSGIGGIAGGSAPVIGMNGMTQQQQNLLDSIRQQQEVLTRGTSMGIPNNLLMNVNNAGSVNVGMGMMGATSPGNFAMMAPQASMLQHQQQQQQSFDMGLFQQQQRVLLLQQQMQQQQQAITMPQIMSMQNTSIMQQQQQQLHRQRQNSSMGMFSGNFTEAGMVMMGGNLPSVVPGMVNAAMMGSIGLQRQVAGANACNGDGSSSKGIMGSIPPPASGATPTQPRLSSTGGDHGDESNLMSPGSFESFNW